MTDYRYEVWAFVYDENDCITDWEECLGAYESSSEAIDFAESFEYVEQVLTDTSFSENPYLNKLISLFKKKNYYMLIEVEKVVEDEEGNIYCDDVLWDNSIWMEEKT